MAQTIECSADNRAAGDSSAIDMGDGEVIDFSSMSAADLLAEVAGLEPGSFVIAVLQMIDRSSLSPDEAITFLQIHARVSAWWSSLEQELLVIAASPEPLIEEYTVLVPVLRRGAHHPDRGRGQG